MICTNFCIPVGRVPSGGSNGQNRWLLDSPLPAAATVGAVELASAVSIRAPAFEHAVAVGIDEDRIGEGEAASRGARASRRHRLVAASHHHDPRVAMTSAGSPTRTESRRASCGAGLVAARLPFTHISTRRTSIQSGAHAR